MVNRLLIVFVDRFQSLEILQQEIDGNADYEDHIVIITTKYIKIRSSLVPTKTSRTAPATDEDGKRGPPPSSKNYNILYIVKLGYLQYF